MLSAGGTVTIRQRDDGEQEVLLVHRPRYDDWSLPKGKLNPDEYLPGCAVRETREESGLKVRLGIPLERVTYEVGSGIKTVCYWRADVVKAGKFKPSDEVDKIRWLPVAKAIAKASYPEEPGLIRQAVGLASSTPVLIVRHAKAMLRSNWIGRDQGRPLTERGRRQSQLLVPLLSAYGVRRLVASTSTRCMRTLSPYAHDRHLEMEGWTTLSEEMAEQYPDQVGTLMKRLIAETVQARTPLAICGHRPVLPAMFAAVGIPDRHLQPATCIVAHMGDDGLPLAVEVHKPRV